VSDLAELLRSVIARPDDHDVLRIYADALAMSGDVRGELIIVQLERMTADSEALVDREIELCTQLDTSIATALAQSEARFTWHRGFLDEIDFSPPVPRIPLGDSLRKLGVMPEARRLRRIVIRFVEPGWGPLGPIIAQLAKVAPQLRALRELAFTMRPRDDDHKPLRPSNFGPLWPLCRAIPKLEVLELSGTDYSTMRELKLPSLKRYVLEDPRSDDFYPLSDNSMPNLEELEIRGFKLGQDLGWLDRAKTRLRALHFSTTSKDAMRDFTQRLPPSKVFRSVRSLSLRGVPIDKRCVDNLVAHAAIVRQLERLAIDSIAKSHEPLLVGAVGPIVVY
jgi:uncharacterized protein (TIGR02996 family)